MTEIEVPESATPVPLVVFRKRYVCPHCRRYQRSTEKPVLEHMGRCWSDPAKRTCRTCQHLIRATSEYGDRCRLGEPLPEDAPVVGCLFWEDRDDEGTEFDD